VYQLYRNTVNLVQQRTETQYVLLFLFPLPFEPIEGGAFSSESLKTKQTAIAWRETNAACLKLSSFSELYIAMSSGFTLHDVKKPYVSYVSYSLVSRTRTLK
jgi:hypothetical protein